MLVYIIFVLISVIADNSMQKWYHTQRTRFSKLREGQPKTTSQKRSGAGLSSGDEEDLVHGEEASESDTDRDKFIRRVFGFLRPHIRRHKKDTPASVSISLKLNSNRTLLQTIVSQFNFHIYLILLPIFVFAVYGQVGHGRDG